MPDAEVHRQGRPPDQVSYSLGPFEELHLCRSRERSTCQRGLLVVPVSSFLSV